MDYLGGLAVHFGGFAGHVLGLGAHLGGHLGDIKTLVGHFGSLVSKFIFGRSTNLFVARCELTD